MPDRLSLKYASAALLLAVGVSVSSPAQAGFQWVAPSEPLAAPPMNAPVESAPQPIFSPAPPMAETTPSPSFAPAPAPSSAGTSAPEVISPVVISGSSDSQPTQPLKPAQPLTTKNQQTVQGFAKSVPLAVALRQILPTGYAFSIDQDVDMGTLVSFQGGRPWRDTLREALEPVGLVTHEQGQMIAVGYPSHIAPVAETKNPAAPIPVFQTGREPKPLPSAASIPLSALTPAPAMSASPMIDVGGTNMRPGPSAPTNQTWTAERGEHLRKILEGWCHRANVEFEWASEYDYPLEASFTLTGNFESAVRNLLTGFQGAHPQPVAELHANSNLGQMVLIVQTRGNTNSD